MFKKKLKPAEQREAWKHRFRLWQSALRDLLMLQLGNTELIAYPEVKSFKQIPSSSQLNAALDQLMDLSNDLGKSYNLRLSLELFALSF